MSAHSLCSWKRALSASSRGIVFTASAASCGIPPPVSDCSSARARSTSDNAATRSFSTRWLSASVIVESSAISNCPAFTLSPSLTKTSRTTLVSSGWMVLLRSLTMIRPCATATMSICPSIAQVSAIRNSAQIAIAALLGAGCGGVSCNSSAAGRKARSSAMRLGPASSSRRSHAALNTAAYRASSSRAG